MFFGGFLTLSAIVAGLTLMSYINSLDHSPEESMGVGCVFLALAISAIVCLIVSKRYLPFQTNAIPKLFGVEVARILKFEDCVYEGVSEPYENFWRTYSLYTLFFSFKGTAYELRGLRAEELENLVDKKQGDKFYFNVVFHREAKTYTEDEGPKSWEELQILCR